MLSPASVPSCSVSDESSIAWATTLAVPGVPVRTRIKPLRPTVTGTSDRIRREPLVRGRDDGRRREVLGRDVDVAVAPRDLDEA